MSVSKYTSIRLKRSVKELIRAYKKEYELKSLEKALVNSLVLALKYRSLADALLTYELSMVNKDEQ
jgi:hypothetical protein